MTLPARTPDRPLPVAAPERPFAPAASGVTEAQREAVAQVLAVAFANDRLSMDALDERMALTYSVNSLTELEALLADLPVVPNPEQDPGLPPVIAPESIVPPRGVAMAFMGGVERTGSWVVPRHFKMIAVMGGGGLDLRHARFGAGVTEIELMCFMGGFEIIVPPGVRVEMLGTALMGGFSASAGDATVEAPGAPVLRVTGIAVMGGVDVKMKGPSKKALKKYELALRRARRG